MNKEKFLLMSGLCKKAGCMIIGTPMVTKFLPTGKIITVFYASNASANTEKKILDKCSFYKVKCIKIDVISDEIAHAIGNSGAVCALGITDKNFADELTSLILNEKR